MKRIGVRELRQNASEYLRLVENGESIEITDRGRLVAMLVPSANESSHLELLQTQGRLGPDLGDVLELGAHPERWRDGPVEAPAVEESSVPAS